MCGEAVDLVNFACPHNQKTAWCSEREPRQVFTILENLYHAFDSIGKTSACAKIIGTDISLNLVDIFDR